MVSLSAASPANGGMGNQKISSIPSQSWPDSPEHHQVSVPVFATALVTQNRQNVEITAIPSIQGMELQRQ